MHLHQNENIYFSSFYLRLLAFSTPLDLVLIQVRQR